MEGKYCECVGFTFEPEKKKAVLQYSVNLQIFLVITWVYDAGK